MSPARKSALIRLWQRLHDIFGMHHLELRPMPGRRGFKARCRCGLYLAKANRG